VYHINCMNFFVKVYPYYVFDRQVRALIYNGGKDF